MWRRVAWITLAASVIVSALSKRVLPRRNQLHATLDAINVRGGTTSSADIAERSVQPRTFWRKLKGKKKQSPSKPVVATSPSEHLVTALPGLPDGALGTKHYAGYIPVTEGFQFYWLFESAGSDPDHDPLVIWLNGGPGCSSMDGLWLENGPLRVDDDHHVTINPYSWHNVANMLYVDQPLGTGLSYTTTENYADNDTQIDSQFHLFLSNFLKLHSGYMASGSRSRPIYFTGESHAGHYIPSMIAHIFKTNEAVDRGDDQDGIILDVRGMAIGNGWLDPVNQYDVSDFAFGMGLIDGGQRRAMKRKADTCVASVKSGNYQTSICLSLMDEIVADSGGGGHGVPRVSMYDVRNFESGRDFPPGHRAVESYLNRDDVRKAVHASSCPIAFQECTDPPYRHLAKWDGLGVTNEIRAVLNAGVRSLFFNGQFDLICNHVGNEKVLLNLGGWKGAEEWEASKRGVWLSDGKGERDNGRPRPIGYVKEAKGNPLTFLVVLDSGHMVPLDHPRAALDMILRFLQGKPFSDGTQNLPTIPCRSGAGVGGGGECYDFGTGANDAVEAGEDSPALVAALTHAAAATPPKIECTPEVGKDFAIVRFSGVEDAKDATSEWEIEYEVVSSPDGLVGTGASSPITVKGLTPGRSYTFSVAAVYHSVAGEENGAKPSCSKGTSAPCARSASSVGSPAVTPGCRSPSLGTESEHARETYEEACGAHGRCREDDAQGVCVCQSGYWGDHCEFLSVATGDTREGGGGDPSREEGAIKVLSEKDIRVLSDGASSSNVPSEMKVRFALRPGAFRDPEFVYAIITPPIQPKDDDTKMPRPSTINVDSEASSELWSAFSTLLRTDVGKGLGVSMTSVTVTGVAPVSEAETRIDWKSWQEWGTRSLDVSVVVTTEAPITVGRKLISVWNDPESRFHLGVITGLVDFSKGAEVKISSLNAEHERTTTHDTSQHGFGDKRKYRGPGLLATFLYIMGFALTVPMCGVSRRFWSRRRSRRCGGSYSDGGVLGVGGESSTTRRGWRNMGGGNRGGGRGVGSFEDHEKMPLSAGGREGDGDFELTENAVGKRI